MQISEPKPTITPNRSVKSSGSLRAIAVGLAGAFLAVLTLNFLAGRVCNEPSRRNAIFSYEKLPGVPIRWQLEGNGTSWWCSNNIRRAAMPAAGAPAPWLIIGDSFTEAFHVSDDEHFAHLLENGLPDGMKRPVLAFGRSAYSVADYIAKAPEFSKLFSPYWVVIQVNPDDFYDDAWNANKPVAAHFVADPNKPETVEIHDWKPVPPSKLGHIRDLLGDYAAQCPLTSFSQERWMQIRNWIAREKPWFKIEQRASGPVLRKPTYPIDTEMRLLAEAYHHRLTILYLPEFDPKNPEAAGEKEKELAEAAKTHKVRFVTLRDKFPDLARQGLAPYGFDNTRFNLGHWNRFGHQAGAELLLRECESIEKQSATGPW